MPGAVHALAQEPHMLMLQGAVLHPTEGGVGVRRACLQGASSLAGESARLSAPGLSARHGVG